MNAQVQRSYNWAYLAVCRPLRFQRFVIPAIEQGRPPNELIAILNRFSKDLALAAEELRALSGHLGSSPLGSSAEALGLVSGQLAHTAATFEVEGRSAATTSLLAVLSKLERVKLLLDQQSPVKFRAWFLNPWRNYPTRIADAKLPARKKPPSVDA